MGEILALLGEPQLQREQVSTDGLNVDAVETVEPSRKSRIP